jgi:putative tryptophan/tyrosine transport system substrate-binding protein
MWRHRTFAVIAASLILSASQAWGQQQVHRIGYFGSAPIPEIRQAWLQGLREHGYVEGQNLHIEYRYSQGQSEKYPALIAELIASNPEIIVTSQSNPALMIHTTAPSIPLVLAGVGDPVGLGLVESLRHPGGNVTGIAGLVPERFLGKQLTLLKDLVPQASRIAVLIDPTMTAHQQELRRLPGAARQVGVELFTVEASKPDQYEDAFEKAHARGAGAIEVLNGPLPFVHRAEIAKLAARHRLPAMYLERRYVEDGGLLSYGTNSADLFRRAGGFVDKILKGERPGDIPVEQPTRFELIVNLKAAKELGITVPSSILAQADEVIE